MGHGHTGPNATTAIYVPDDPDYLRDAAAALEDIMQDVRKHVKTALLDDPVSSLGRLANLPRRGNQHLPSLKREEMLEWITAGKSAGEVRKAFGVSYELVYKYQRKLGLK
jgi:hypothetical protein